MRFVLVIAKTLIHENFETISSDVDVLNDRRRRLSNLSESDIDDLHTYLNLRKSTSNHDTYAKLESIVQFCTKASGKNIDLDLLKNYITEQLVGYLKTGDTIETAKEKTLGKMNSVYNKMNFEFLNDHPEIQHRKYLDFTKSCVTNDDLCEVCGKCRLSIARTNSPLKFDWKNQKLCKECDHNKLSERQEFTQKILGKFLNGRSQICCEACEVVLFTSSMTAEELQKKVMYFNFDHKDVWDKKFNIGFLMRSASASEEVILKEMEKCRILCLSCHCMKTTIEKFKLHGYKANVRTTLGKIFRFEDSDDVYLFQEDDVGRSLKMKLQEATAQLQKDIWFTFLFELRTFRNLTISPELQNGYEECRLKNPFQEKNKLQSIVVEYYPDCKETKLEEIETEVKLKAVVREKGLVETWCCQCRVRTIVLEDFQQQKPVCVQCAWIVCKMRNKEEVKDEDIELVEVDCSRCHQEKEKFKTIRAISHLKLACCKCEFRILTGKYPLVQEMQPDSKNRKRKEPTTNPLDFLKHLFDENLVDTKKLKTINWNE